MTNKPGHFLIYHEFFTDLRIAKLSAQAQLELIDGFTKAQMIDGEPQLAKRLMDAAALDELTAAGMATDNADGTVTLTPPSNTISLDATLERRRAAGRKGAEARWGRRG